MKRNLTITVFLILFLLIQNSVSATDNLIFEHLSTEDGLSHGSVSAMLKDQHGFMWFATWDGINRYDGQNFKTFKPSNAPNEVQASNRIEQMKEDSLGNIWVFTYNNKIFRLNHFTEVFDQIPGDNEFPNTNITGIFSASTGDVWLLSDNNGAFRVTTDTSTYTFQLQHFNKETEPSLPGNQISFLNEDAEHNIWINTNEGIVVLKFDSEGCPCSKETFTAGTQTQFRKNSLSCFYETPSQIFFGTSTGHLLVYEKHNGQLHELPIETNAPISYISGAENNVIYLGTQGNGVFEYKLLTEKIKNQINDPSVKTVLKMYPDSKGNIWIESTNAGISKINTSTGNFRHYEQKLNINPNIRSTAQCGLMEDEHQTLWLTLKGGGFGYYNPENDEVEYFYNEPDKTESKISNFVNCFYKDPSGVLWMSTYFKGIEKVTFVDQKFQLVQPAPQLNLSLANEVRAIMEDSEGMLWIATKNQEVFLLNKNYEVVHKISVLIGQPIGLVYALLEDTAGNIYLGTKGNGLFQLKRKGLFQFEVEHYLYNPNKVTSISNDNIYALLQDHQGRIWVATYGGGLNLKNGEEFIHAGNTLKNYPIEQGSKARHLTEDKAGNLWISTTNGIVFLQTDESKPTEFSFELYNCNLGNANGLRSNDVFWTFCDARNNLWMASLGGGLSRLLNYPKGNEQLQFSTLTKDDGLPSDVIFTITGDESGNLWMATENGIASYNPQKHVFKNYNRYDGILSSGFSEAAIARRPDGSICMGANNGVYWFYPKSIETQPKKIALEFTSFQLFGKEVVPVKNTVLTKSITETDFIQLKYNQNVLDISWAALDYKMQDKIQFDYKLEGFDTGWHLFSDQTRANYTKLPPGKYAFQVRFSNPGLQAINPLKQINIEILPPFWLTTWAYIIYLILTIFLVEIARRIITSMIRLRNKLVVEKELNNIKLNFFTNISHELRTPLTLILGPVKELHKKEDLNEKEKAYVSLIEHNAQRLLRLVNQLLDFRKIESLKMQLLLNEVDIVEVVKNVCLNFHEIAIEKNIRFDLNLPVQPLFISVDEEKMDSVLFNLLSNAFKFTPNGGSIELGIHLLSAGNTLEIEVVDHGIGITKEQEATLFEVFSSHQHHSAQRGSGIGLAFSKELVKLHKGELVYRPTSGGGATFAIQLQANSLLTEQLPQSVQLKSERKPTEQQKIRSYETPGNHRLPKLLIVEDNNELRNFLSLQLNELYAIEEAVNGEEGWLKAQQFQPDLILSDVMMPKMDGIQLLEKIKTNFATSHIPLVLLTAKSSVESKIEGLRYGADAYLTKPFNNEQIKAQLENLLHQRVLLRQRYAKFNGQPNISNEVSITDSDALFLKEITEIIQKNLSNTEFKTEKLYRQMGMGRSKFYDKVKGLTGLSPIEYIMEVRLNKAQQLLQDGNHNVTETSYLSGFTDAGYFSKCFKERFGVNPSHYSRV